MNHQVPEVSLEELLLPRPIRCELSRVFATMATVFFYLHRISRKENSACSACDTLHRASIISSSTVLPLNPFVNLSLAPLSIFNLWSSPWGVARLLGLRGVPPCPQPSEGVG